METDESNQLIDGGESPAPAGSQQSEGPAQPQPDSGGEASETQGDGQGPAKSEASPAGDEAAPSKSREETWKDRRLQRLYAENRALKERERANAAAVQAQAPASPAPSDEARVQQLFEVERFNRDCAAVVENGKAVFGDFDAKVEKLREFTSGFDERQQVAYGQLLRAVIDTGKGPELVHQLGSDLDLADRLLGMSPVQLGMELAKMTQAAATAKTPAEAPATKAPEPPTPIADRSSANNPIDPSDRARADKLSTEEWMARRNAQALAAKEATGKSRVRFAR